MQAAALSFLLAVGGAVATTSVEHRELSGCVSPWGQCGGQGWTTCCDGGWVCKSQNQWYSQCSPPPVAPPSCASPWAQCGGKTWTGKTCCTTGYTCVWKETYYSQCKPVGSAPAPAPAPAPKPAPAPAPAPVPAANCAKLWDQCGGQNYNGAKCCVSGSSCVFVNSWYSQCKTGPGIGGVVVPAPAPAPQPAPAPAPKPAPAPAPAPAPGGNAGYSPVNGGLAGNGMTTRYWDCAKPSCSWPGKAAFTAPVKNCAANGVTVIDNNTFSGTDGYNGAFVCTNNMPFVSNTDPNVAYGFVAMKSSAGEQRTCCTCMELTFTNTQIAGKKFIVQVTNTGMDLNSDGHFDLMMPGGGIGLMNGCVNQWPGGYQWGQQYGGITSNTCYNLPPALQAGCNWRFNWFEGADNPAASFREITCPDILTNITGCKRY